MTATNLLQRNIASQRKFQNYQNYQNLKNINESKTMIKKIIQHLLSVLKQPYKPKNNALLQDLPDYIKRDIGISEQDINNRLPKSREKAKPIKYGNLWL